MKRIITTAFAACLSLLAMAQSTRIVGKIVDSNNQPIPGATVMVKGTTIGTVADVDGNYSIEADANSTLVFSFIGMTDQEVQVAGQNTINATLADEASDLDEVVVIGYGAVRKGDLTSSISALKGEALEKISTGNVMNALQGQVNGVQVSSAGSPGASPRVIVRGVTTVNGSDPLYVVDGMPVGTNINFLNQNDIESMQVLKDASASAIYGTRGSNGVILVTTKRGAQGKTKFSLTASVGFQTLHKPEMAKASEYEQVIKTRYTNDGATPVWNGKDGITDEEGTDWWDEVINDVALQQNYNFSFSGGNDRHVYSASIGYYRQNSQYDYGVWQKFTARFSNEWTFNKVVKAGIDLTPKYEQWDNTPSLMGSIMAMDPTTPVMRDESEWTSNVYSNYARSRNNQEWNPVASVARMDAGAFEYGVLATPSVTITPIEGLSIRSQFGLNARFRVTDTYNVDFKIDNLEQNANNNATRQMENWADWNWTNTVTWMRTFDEKHNLNVMAGFTMERFQDYWASAYAEDIPSNEETLRYPSAGTNNMKAYGKDSFSSLISYLARVMYNYDERYYLTASVRVDGSSKFPSGNKYATFPAVSAAWRLTGEQFMQDQDIFQDIKIRAGWGRVGNQNIDNSAYESSIANTDYVFNGERVTGSTVGSIGNSKVQWETVEDWNVGVDFALFDNRLKVTADYYQKTSHDMLMKKENLLILGYPMWNGQMWENIGKMEAKGWELGINWSDVAGEIHYNVGVNLSQTRNKAIKLNGDYLYTGSFNGDYIIRNEEGRRLSQFYGYVADGLFQNETELTSYTNEFGTAMQPNAKVGDIRYLDLNHDGTIDEKDKTYIGDPYPDLMIGLNLGLEWKGIDFTANFYGTVGNDIFNQNFGRYSGVNGQNVYAGTLEKAWHGEGTSYRIPRLSVNDSNMNFKRPSSAFVEDGSYFRCKLMQIGYTLPQSIFNDKLKARISFSAQNLFTATSYSGEDPEQASMGSSVTEAGIDGTGYPNPRTFLIGLNLNF